MQRFARSVTNGSIENMSSSFLKKLGQRPLIKFMYLVSNSFFFLMSKIRLYSTAKSFSINSNSTNKILTNQIDYPNLIRTLQKNTEPSSLDLGKKTHSLLIQAGLANGLFAANHLINMYSKCGAVESARQVFDKMQDRNLFSWNIMIAGHVHNGHQEEPILLYKQMGWEKIKSDGFTLSSVLVSCGEIRRLEQGRQVHSCVIRDGFESDLIVSSSILDMYCKCGEIEDAHHVFDKITNPNLVSWGSMIVGYGRLSCEDQVLRLFKRFISSGFSPDRVVLSSSLRSCGNLLAGDLGLQVHTWIVKIGFESDQIVGSALVRTYSQLGNLGYARRVFEKFSQLDLVLWSSMIVGYGQSSYEEDALKLYKKMRAGAIPADQFILSSILSACASLSALDYGKAIQAQTIKMGFDQDKNVVCATINMNSKCGNLVDAIDIFSQFEKPDITIFNSMISGYARSGHGEEALELMRQIQILGLIPDQYTFSSVLGSCSFLAALDPGKQNHAFAYKTGFGSDLTVQSSLIGMYAKSGCLQEAHQVFNLLKERNLVSWNAAISAHAEHGRANESIRLFDRMREDDGLEPDSITYLSLLSACRHVGLIDEGLKLFNSMNNKDSTITPGLEHYCCMIDLFSRAARFEEAINLIETMRVEPDSAVWGALLSGCRTHGNIELGEFAAQKLQGSEMGTSGGSTLLSNLYASHGRWNEVLKSRKMTKELNMGKIPGCSWIELRGMVHVFVSSDLSHPQRVEVMALLEVLIMHIKEDDKLRHIDTETGVGVGHGHGVSDTATPY